MIIVMDGGKIVQTGNHEELMRTNEIYRETYLQQTNREADNETNA